MNTGSTAARQQTNQSDITTADTTLTENYNNMQSYNLGYLTKIFADITAKIQALQKENTVLSSNLDTISPKIQQIKERFAQFIDDIIKYNTARKGDLTSLKMLLNTYGPDNSVVHKLLDDIIAATKGKDQATINALKRQFEDQLDDILRSTNNPAFDNQPLTKYKLPVSDSRQGGRGNQQQQNNNTPVSKQSLEEVEASLDAFDALNLTEFIKAEKNANTANLSDLLKKLLNDQLYKDKTIQDEANRIETIAKVIKAFPLIKSETLSKSPEEIAELIKAVYNFSNVEKPINNVETAELLNLLKQQGGAKTRRRKNKRRKTAKKYGGYQTETKKHKKRRIKRSSKRSSSQRSSSKRISSDSLQRRK